VLLTYDTYSNRIVFSDHISTGILPHFAAAIRLWRERGPANSLTFDFSRVSKAFANGMLGVIATANNLRSQGVDILVTPPYNQIPRRFFSSTNWAHLLDPRLTRTYNKRNHFVQRFSSYEELPDVVNNFMEVVLRHIQMPRDIQSALEWSVNEICDNVINHAQTGAGGYLQVIAYPKHDLIAFTVADAGRGILHSLREGIPTLEKDVQAIEEAIKAGVTRNKQFGQGNGLAGTYRITSMTGGSLDILTGEGRLLFERQGNKTFEYGNNRSFQGTCVSGQIVLSHQFSVRQALTFGAIPYEPYTIVDQKYEMQDEDALLVKMSEQEGGTGTRAAGGEMHTMILNLMEAKPGYPIYLNWENVEVIASSFADEFLGKLFVKLGKVQFEAVIKNIYINDVVEHIISKAISERAAD
jgi:anti-sigma regulatory factor (Ser/Thr protein kinase)